MSSPGSPGLTYLTEGIFRPDVLAEVDGQVRLVGTRCQDCGDTRFPPALACPKCHAGRDSLEPVALSAEGTVVTASRVDRAIPPFEAPYLLGYVEVQEGVRVLCQIVSPSGQPDQVIGRPCRLRTAPLFVKDEVEVSGYKFEVTT